MNIDPLLFRRELGGWALRGILCAAPSAYWAVMVEFNRPAEIAAMITGVALYVTAFAGFSAWGSMRATAGRERFVRALKMSAWLKSGALAGGVLAWVAATWMKNGMEAWFVVGMGPDLWAGFGSLAFMGWLAGAGQGGGIARMDSFGWTLATTVMQGVIITLLLMLLALAVVGACRLRERFNCIASTG